MASGLGLGFEVKVGVGFSNRVWVKVGFQCRVLRWVRYWVEFQDRNPTLTPDPKPYFKTQPRPPNLTSSRVLKPELEPLTRPLPLSQNLTLTLTSTLTAHPKTQTRPPNPTSISTSQPNPDPCPISHLVIKCMYQPKHSLQYDQQNAILITFCLSSNHLSHVVSNPPIARPSDVDSQLLLKDSDNPCILDPMTSIYSKCLLATVFCPAQH